MKVTRSPIEDLDLISAIWILACNDDNPLITYRGLSRRLGLADDFDIVRVVRSRPELFRPGVTRRRLETWKEEMRANKRIPGWIRDLPTSAERLAAIENLQTADVFRSQFRSQAIQEERSPIEVIRWGLEHLDRLRKATSEVKEARVRRIQMWLVFFVGLGGIVTQIAMATLREPSPTTPSSCQPITESQPKRN